MVLTDLLNGKTGIDLLKSKPGACFKEASQCSRSNVLYAVAQQAMPAKHLRRPGVRSSLSSPK